MQDTRRKMGGRSLSRYQDLVPPEFGLSDDQFSLLLGLLTDAVGRLLSSHEGIPDVPLPFPVFLELLLQDAVVVLQLTDRLGQAFDLIGDDVQEQDDLLGVEAPPAGPEPLIPNADGRPRHDPTSRSIVSGMWDTGYKMEGD